jgi:hypothetical protein
LQRQADQVRDLQSRLAAEREVLDRKQTAATAELDAREKAVRKRGV